MLLDTKPKIKEKTVGRKVSALLIAVFVHVAIIALALLIAVMPTIKEEPEIVAQVVAPVIQTEIKLEKKQVVKQAKEASASAAAAPIAKLIRSNSVAKIAVPEVTKFSDGPIGLGEGDFGSGFGNGGGGGGGSGSGMGSGMTMFGSRGGEGLMGTFYDLKQDQKGKPTSIDAEQLEDFNKVMQTAAERRFSSSVFRDYFKAPNQINFTFLAIPTMRADEGPAAFAVEKLVQPKGWLVHYSGTVSPPKSGRWRFVGMFDDALVVCVNNRVVFDGCIIECFDDSRVRSDFGGPILANKTQPFSGKWVDLSGAFKIDILVGERPGGSMGGALMVEHEGSVYDKRQDGTAILPVFSTGSLDSTAKNRLRGFPYDFAREAAVFRPSTKRL